MYTRVGPRQAEDRILELYLVFYMGEILVLSYVDFSDASRGSWIGSKAFRMVIQARDHSTVPQVQTDRILITSSLFCLKCSIHNTCILLFQELKASSSHS